MVGVAEHHLGAGLDEIARFQRLYRRERSDIHENRRLHRAVGGFKPPKSCVRARILFYDLKMHRGIFYQKPLPNFGK